LNKALGNIQTPQSIAATAAAETLSRYQTSHYGAVAALNKALGNIQTPQSIAATAAAETLSRYQTSHYETLFSATNIASKALQKRNAGILWSTGTLTREYFELAQSLSAFSDALRPISRYPALSPVSALTAARNLQKTLGSNSSFKMPAAQSATEALWSADAATLTEHVNDLLSHEDTRSKVGALSDIFDATLEKDSSAKSKRRKYRLSNADPGILIFSSLVMLLSLTGDAVGAVDPDIAPIVDHHATTLGIAVAMILYIHDQLRKD
ncbi:hypothetical protein, partial [Streptomyces griseoaurantiacus]|uniref:hypothetical protein n=1 Tax=Streptomyces griseoaurantiacus TaxID=68213 RepID=UPI0037FC6C5D